MEEERTKKLVKLPPEALADALLKLAEHDDMAERLYYETLLPMAKSMESESRMLAAYVIYRALLESILDRKFYKAYPHAAKYLRKLDHLAAEIEDWQDLGEHGMYHVWLNQVHGKKSSFWKHYRGE